MKITSSTTENNHIQLKFNQKLQKARLIKRLNRFVAEIELNGQKVLAHAPTTGKIAGIPIEQMDCLVSGPYENRKTTYTVEAISFWTDNDYAGINQNFANRLVEHCLQTEHVQTSLGVSGALKREVKVNDSRLDFQIGQSFVEVKTLVNTWYGKRDLPTTPTASYSSVERMHKHVNQLKELLVTNQANKVIMLSAFLYDAKKFTPPTEDEHYHKFVNDFKIASDLGLEQWQMNFHITDSYAELTHLEKLQIF